MKTGQFTASPKDLTLAQVHLTRAFELEEANEFEAAMKECNTAIRLAPDYADAYNLQGVLFESLDRQEEAITAYGEAIRLDPAFQEARDNLASATKDKNLRIDTSATIKCRNCGQPIQTGEEILLKPKQKKASPLAFCKPCTSSLERLFQAEAEDINYIGGLLVGSTAALLAILIWFGIVVWTQYKVGLIALAFGWITGKATIFGAGAKRGPILQAMSAGLALGGMLVSEYLIIRYYSVQALASEGITGIPFLLPPPIILALLRESILGQPMTILFMVIAVWVAYSIPARRRLVPASP